MKVNFVKTVIPCVSDDIAIWHHLHGWLWDVVEVPTGRRIGVYYCTLLCGDGVIVHFDVVPDVEISAATLLHAIRKGIRMVLDSEVNVIYATICADRAGLLCVVKRLGFRESGSSYMRAGKKVLLLQYFGR